MNIGELWVAHPLFPWLMIILAAWVGFSTAAQVRNWMRIRKLEQHNKLLQEMVVGGVGYIARQVKGIQPESSGREEECTSELCSGKNGIRTEEQPAAAIEETDEDWNLDSPAGSKNTERAKSRNT